jgi:FMN phosphatase YigB (HAD superfamily)
VFKPSGIKLLIVDLDNTLCDTFHSLSRVQWHRAADALAKRGWKKEARQLRSYLGKVGFVRATELLHLTAEQQRIGIRQYDKVSVKNLKLYDDAQAILSLPIPKVLVTRGEKELQLKKIKHLRLRKYFEGIYYVNTFGSKKTAFENILKRFHRKPHEALVIGDRAEEEIKDANELGIASVLVLRPEWPVTRKYKATFTVKSLRRVSELLRK